MWLVGYFHLNGSVEHWRQKTIFLRFAPGQAVFPFCSFIMIMITSLPTPDGVSLGPSLFLIRSRQKTKFRLCLKSSGFFFFWNNRFKNFICLLRFWGWLLNALTQVLWGVGKWYLKYHRQMQIPGLCPHLLTLKLQGGAQEAANIPGDSSEQ